MTEYQTDYLEDIGLLKEIKKLNIYQPNSINEKPEILKDYEQYNVDVPSQANSLKKVLRDMIYEKINERKEYIQNLGVDNQPYSFNINYNNDNDKNSNMIQPEKMAKGGYNFRNFNKNIRDLKKKLSQKTNFFDNENVD